MEKLLVPLSTQSSGALSQLTAMCWQSKVWIRQQEQSCVLQTCCGLAQDNPGLEQLCLLLPKTKASCPSCRATSELRAQEQILNMGQ